MVSNQTWKTLLLGACCAVSMSASASAAVVLTQTFVDFTSKPFSFGFDVGSSDFTLSNTRDGFFGSPVAVSTSGGGAVRTIFGSPSVDFDPPRNATPYDSSLNFGSFSSATPISSSGPASLLGLADTTSDGTHYGFAEFYQNTLVSYAFESRPGVAIVPLTVLSPVPLPASAPMFGAALLALGAVGYGVRFKKAAAAA